MSSNNGSPHMQRSFSMPVQPLPLPMKTMKRSQEKETLYEEDYYPESPSCERRRKSHFDNREQFGGTHSISDNNITSADWAGSTIELNSDLRRNETDTIYNPRKPYRVIEKSGRENVIFKRIPEKSWRYIRDFVTTLVRFLLPKRYLMNSKASATTSSSLASFSAPNLTSTTVNIAAQKTGTSLSSSSSPSLRKEEDNDEIIEDALDKTTINKSEIKCVNKEDRQIQEDSEFSKDDNCPNEDRRVKFSLYD